MPWEVTTASLRLRSESFVSVRPVDEKTGYVISSINPEGDTQRQFGGKDIAIGFGIVKKRSECTDRICQKQPKCSVSALSRFSVMWNAMQWTADLKTRSIPIITSSFMAHLSKARRRFGR